MAVRNIAVVANCGKQQALSYAWKVVERLTELGCGVRLDEPTALATGLADLACTEESLCETDLIITLGGDGTILTASHFAAPHNIPILGVHMGRFGFIAETHPDDLFNQLGDILDAELQIEERIMVHGDVLRGGEVVFSAFGLNDVVLNKGAMARMLRLHTHLGGDPIGTYPADGVIVATPTGSTAYALSAGGPLVEPTVQALIVAPICAHTLTARPIIIPAHETVEITVETDGGEVLFVADSYRVFPLKSGDTVAIHRSEYNTRIVTLGHASFYRKIHQRLLWGERLNA